MRRVLKGICIIFSSILIFMAGFYFFGFRLNTTDSIPKGVYRLVKTGIEKNGYVMFCPDSRAAFQVALKNGYLEPGFCPSGMQMLMKKVVALSGDVVSSTPKGIYVNGRVQPYSKPKRNDGFNRELPHWRIANYQLRNNEVLTMTSQSEWSYDARYYGLIKKAQIKGMVTPVWVQHKRGFIS